MLSLSPSLISLFYFLSSFLLVSLLLPPFTNNVTYVKRFFFSSSFYWWQRVYFSMICALSEWLFFFVRWFRLIVLGCAGSFQLRTSSPAVSISALLYLCICIHIYVYLLFFFRIGRRDLHMKSPVVVISITSLISSYVKVSYHLNNSAI
jgi:hypothetical protein